jgi:hypothetical protein
LFIKCNPSSNDVVWTGLSGEMQLEAPTREGTLAEVKTSFDPFSCTLEESNSRRFQITPAFNTSSPEDALVAGGKIHILCAAKIQEDALLLTSHEWETTNAHEQGNFPQVALILK